ncbi:urea transporter [bacterium]|nr:urea transporter [bacterium]
MMRKQSFILSIVYGYGQLFLCKSLPASILFFAVLLLSSPVNTMWSLLGAILVSLTALLFRADRALLHSGLFSVNGILLGYSWIFFPEVPTIVKVLSLIVFSIVCGFVLALVTRKKGTNKRQILPFTIPYVLLIWLQLLLLDVTGSYSFNFYKGWQALANRETVAAQDKFKQISIESPRPRAYQQDGLGWSEFFNRKYPAARFHFQEAITLHPQFADAYDGLGWSLFKLGDYANAEIAFEKAVEIDPGLADSWDGLGWIHLQRRELERAATSFRNAIIAAPLFADAWFGLHRSTSANGDLIKSAKILQVHGFIKSWIPSKYSFTRSTQLLAWFLLLVGILLHSRISGLVTVFTLVLLGVVIHHFPSANSTNMVNTTYNLAALAIAAGGHYLRPSKITWLLLTGIMLLFYFAWTPLETFLLALDLPILSLPFNIFILVALTSGVLIEKFSNVNVIVPFSVAVTTPERVRIWHIRRETAEIVWDRMKNEQQQI